MFEFLIGKSVDYRVALDFYGPVAFQQIYECEALQRLEQQKKQDLLRMNCFVDDVACQLVN